jgi:predicted amidohydrolase YtcJ
MLQLFAEVNPKGGDLRWRIEHAQVVDPADFELFRKYSIIPSVQPTHATSDMYWASERLGSVRVRSAYAYKKLLEQNGWIAFGTDFPIEEIDPLLTFCAAVFRRDAKGYPEKGWQMDNAVSREEALRAMTIWAAKACFEEEVKGSIEPDKYADFVMLDTDLMSADEAMVRKTKVMGVWSAGLRVYQDARSN